MIHISGQADAAFGLDGVLPVKQPRGQRSRDRLLSAGQRLVAQRGFDALSVADIARAAGCSVGAFYQRFRDKDAFFGALIAHYLAEGRAATIALYETCDDERLIGELVASTTERFRRFSGLIRSAIRKRMENPSVWDPIRDSGHFNASCFIAWLTARRGAALASEEEITVRFAFQVLYGTLNNALVNQPGPLDIADPAFLVQLERAFRLVLFADAAAAGAITPATPA